MPAVRTFYWLADRDADLAKRFARAFVGAYFGEGRDVSPPEAMAAVAAREGIAADAVLAAIETPAVKERLKQETDAAMARGVFGAPFIFVDGEAFWGHDRLDQADRWLATGGW